MRNCYKFGIKPVKNVNTFPEKKTMTTIFITLDCEIHRGQDNQLTYSCVFILCPCPNLSRYSGYIESINGLKVKYQIPLVFSSIVYNPRTRQSDVSKREPQTSVPQLTPLKTFLCSEETVQVPHLPIQIHVLHSHTVPKWQAMAHSQSGPHPHTYIKRLIIRSPVTPWWRLRSLEICSWPARHSGVEWGQGR